MSETVTFFIANWDPLVEIVRAGKGPEAICDYRFGGEDAGNHLVECKTTDIHDMFVAWQCMGTIYHLLAPRIDNEDQATMLEELLENFGVIGDLPSDFERIEDLVVGPVPTSSLGTGIYSLSPQTVKHVLSHCADLDPESFRFVALPVFHELAGTDEIDWIQSFDDFAEFCKGLVQLLREANRWSAGIVILIMC